MPHCPDVPNFMPKDIFIEYLDVYVTRIDIRPRYNHTIKFSMFLVSNNKWRIEAENIATGETEVYWSEFLVVAIRENRDGNIPTVKVIVISLEISFDLYNVDANTSVLVRTPAHKEVYLGMSLLKYCPVTMAGTLVMVVTVARLFIYGDLFKYGLFQPKKGSFTTKLFTEKAHVIDVRTSLIYMRSDFDAIVFTTGYKSSVCNWLKVRKRENNLYCAGFLRKGITGTTQDAMFVAKNIRSILVTIKY
ncbi:hypothetical protein N665_0015s0030 [Sinapis alba]|nr:hypothetical protein N665_0015s0030 [Sinapis alba]